MLVTRQKKIFLYFLVELKTSHLYKHDTIDVADPCCMQDVCHIGTLYWTSLTPQSLCGSVVEQQSAASEGLSFDSSWGLTIFSLSHGHDKMKNIILKNDLLIFQHLGD